MHVLEDRTLSLDSSALREAEALIREARGLRRRRWTIGFFVVLAIAGTIYGLVSNGGHSYPSPGQASVASSKQSQSITLPIGPSVKMALAGSLAVGPSGALYVAAPDQHRILVRLADGKFRVVAGTGIDGYSGDGHRAIDARLSNPMDLTFDPAGDLYFVDSGRVRVIKLDGVVVTVAGDGSTSLPPGSNAPVEVAQGIPALDASFQSNPSIAFGPYGVLYIITDTQLLRMTSEGRLDILPIHKVSLGKTTVAPQSFDTGFGTLAIDKGGGIYITGFNGWAIWHITPNGVATYIGYDRGSGGTVPDLVEGPGGSVYAADGGTLMRVTPKKLVPVNRLFKVNGKYFWVTNFAFGPNGTLYADELPGNLGFEALQSLVVVGHAGPKVLWTESQVFAARQN